MVMVRGLSRRVRETRRERNGKVPTRPIRIRPPPIRTDHGSYQPRSRTHQRTHRRKVAGSSPAHISTHCALAGGPETLLVIPFDLSQPPITFVGQSVAGLPRKAPVGANGRRYVPFFGEPLGLIINYSPDHALHCDLEGNPIEWLPAAYPVGQIELTLGSRIKSPRTVAHVLGM